jgi:hypothetical protein
MLQNKRMQREKWWQILSFRRNPSLVNILKTIKKCIECCWVDAKHRHIVIGSCKEIVFRKIK